MANSGGSLVERSNCLHLVSRVSLDSKMVHSTAQYIYIYICVCVCSQYYLYYLTQFSNACTLHSDGHSNQMLSQIYFTNIKFCFRGLFVNKHLVYHYDIHNAKCWQFSIHHRGIQFSVCEYEAKNNRRPGFNKTKFLENDFKSPGPFDLSFQLGNHSA